MIVDLELVRSIEHTGATHCSRQAATLTDARWSCLDGGALIAMGAGRYVNRAFGLGFEATDPTFVLDTMEAFYADSALPPMIEVSPWVHGDLVVELRRRGYTVDDFTSVFAHSLRDIAPRSLVPIDVVDVESEPEWTDVHGARSPVGSPARAVSDEFCAAMRSMPHSVDLLVRLDGIGVAAATFTRLGDIAWFGGAGTRLEQRGVGLQSALIIERLHRSRALGCSLAVATAAPTGPSARNLLRAGFQLLQTRTVLSRR